MKAAVVYGINDLRLEEIEKPQIERDDQILVKNKSSRNMWLRYTYTSWCKSICYLSENYGA